LRPEYIKDRKKDTPSIVNGHATYRAQGLNQRLFRYIISHLLVGVAVFLIFVINLALYWLKIWMKNSSNEKIALHYDMIFSVALALSINLINLAYTGVVDSLTSLENHHTVLYRISERSNCCTLKLAVMT
jgi:hypothetical protein